MKQSYNVTRVMVRFPEDPRTAETLARPSEGRLVRPYRFATGTGSFFAYQGDPEDLALAYAEAEAAREKLVRVHEVALAGAHESQLYWVRWPTERGGPSWHVQIEGHGHSTYSKGKIERIHHLTSEEVALSVPALRALVEMPPEQQRAGLCELADALEDAKHILGGGFGRLAVGGTTFDETLGHYVRLLDSPLARKPGRSPIFNIIEREADRRSVRKQLLRERSGDVTEADVDEWLAIFEHSRQGSY